MTFDDEKTEPGLIGYLLIIVIFASLAASALLPAI